MLLISVRKNFYLIFAAECKTFTSRKDARSRNNSLIIKARDNIKNALKDKKNFILVVKEINTKKRKKDSDS